ncbi:RICIN domain-containing protein [Kitasatospora sp. NPDC058218]|uniref:RICIN domain-containing protein n=1 Tax=Kitasatospora sp. NPDC058218 TaxID=3346385 RepID=UPI0036D9B18D
MTVRSTAKRRLAATAAVAALTLGGALLSAAPASAAFLYKPINIAQDVEVRVQSSDKCLEVADWSTDDGAAVRQWTCTGGDNQKWRFTDGYAVNVHSGKCLEIPGYSTAVGTRADQWTCNKGTNQRWGAVNVNQGTLAIVNFDSDLVLDISGGGFNNGSPAIQWYPTGVYNQRWSFNPNVVL